MPAYNSDESTLGDAAHCERLLLETYGITLPPRPSPGQVDGPSEDIQMLQPDVLRSHIPLAVYGDGICLYRVFPVPCTVLSITDLPLHHDTPPNRRADSGPPSQLVHCPFNPAHVVKCCKVEDHFRKCSKVTVAQVMHAATIVDRAIWERNRSKNRWDETVVGTFTDADWQENFRVSRLTFDYLCDQLRARLQRRRIPVPVEKRVAVALWTLGHLFGVAKSTVCEFVHEVCQAIVHELKKQYIRIPKGQHLREVVETFEDKWQFPQCAGAIDGTHIQEKLCSDVENIGGIGSKDLNGGRSSIADMGHNKRG
ncbi:hypothetical protein Bbelb_050250 [Branchiostoma belcheri]|nr:hypothetical protein Bbelb_050250 [Branchiostoma belcheri]